MTTRTGFYVHWSGLAMADSSDQLRIDSAVDLAKLQSQLGSRNN